MPKYSAPSNESQQASHHYDPPAEPADGCNGSPWCSCWDHQVESRHRPYRPPAVEQPGAA